MNSIDAEALRMLEQYVDEYKIFIDTCSFMFDKIEVFLSRLMPIVEKKGLHILLIFISSSFICHLYSLIIKHISYIYKYTYM